MKKILLATVMALTLCAAGSTNVFSETNPPHVVVSIKPIHALVSGIMQGVAEPTLLIKGGGSPHGYVLRPSEARAVANADLVVWVGHALEGFLEKPLENLAQNAQTLELIAVMKDSLLPIRETGSFDSHGHNDGHHHHEDSEVNPHIWLSPRVAKEIVAQIANELAALDPVRKTQYQENATRLSQRLNVLDQQLAEKLAVVQKEPYIVFHDAYHYFENSYELNAVGALTIDPERKPGAKRIKEIRDKIKNSGAKCIFSEPQFEPRLIATITEGTNVRSGILDPLGADLAPGEDSYFQLLNNLANNLLNGLL